MKVQKSQKIFFAHGLRQFERDSIKPTIGQTKVNIKTDDFSLLYTDNFELTTAMIIINDYFFESIKYYFENTYDRIRISGSLLVSFRIHTPNQSS